jgi:fructose-1,6-bisphosphatase/inositol monophosphatase family enzyme
LRRLGAASVDLVYTACGRFAVSLSMVQASTAAGNYCARSRREGYGFLKSGNWDLPGSTNCWLRNVFRIRGSYRPKLNR